MKKKGNKRVLLSSVCQPFGEEYGDAFSVSHESTYQLSWAQGPFKYLGTNNQWGIDFIAQNLRTPTTTLHYPTLEQFIEAIKEGYEYVGISFIVSTFHKMVPMVEAVRKYSPSSKIILGGYGTVLKDMLSQYADFICEGEGVAFMRELLGEPIDTPIEQPVIVEWMYGFGLRWIPVKGYYSHIFAGLGCPNGCDFCATSAFFKRRHIKLLPDGPSIVRAIQRTRERFPDITDFWISDEDFLLNHARGKGFLDALRKSDLPALSLGVFGSVKALSQYSASELVEMGIDRIWIGYEAKRAGYDKMKGKSFQELFADLHSHGIMVLASMVIGFDYQTEDTILEEFDELMALRPTVCQFSVLTGHYGTPLFEKLMSEGRYIPEIFGDLRNHDGSQALHQHPNISAHRLNELFRHLCEEEYRRLGPTMFRNVDDFMTGYENLKDHRQPRVRAKALKYLKDLRPLLPFLEPSKKYLQPSHYKWVDNIKERIIDAGGEMTLGERFSARMAPFVLRIADLKSKRNVRNQPRFLRREFPEKDDYSPMTGVDLWTHRAMSIVQK